MLLNDKEIIDRIDNHGLITPDEHILVGPSSVDLTLGHSFAFMKSESGYIKLGEEIQMDRVYSDKIIMKPGGFCLATTNEIVSLPDDISAYVEGRSSVGRAGLQVQNAGFIDAGFEGEITLELQNQSPFNLTIEPSKILRICQIVFFKMTDKALNPYDGKYQHQKGATPSMMQKDYDLD